jgi:uncharacterized protein Smg (DUF494 family)
MTNETIEILLHLFGYIREHDFDMEKIKEFSEALVTQGYREKEVTQALSWLFEKISLMSSLPTEIAEQSEKSVRILSEYERMMIQPDVYGYLLKLHSMSLISGSQMEKILDYCMVIGSQNITSSDINDILAALLFEKD